MPKYPCGKDECVAFKKWNGEKYIPPENPDCSECVLAVGK